MEEKAYIGINRMWTCISERGRGWCYALLDECAAGFILGVNCLARKIDNANKNGKRCARDFVAFSSPSESGMRLATKWSGKEDFLVYEE